HPTPPAIPREFGHEARRTDQQSQEEGRVHHGEEAVLAHIVDRRGSDAGPPETEDEGEQQSFDDYRSPLDARTRPGAIDRDVRFAGAWYPFQDGCLVTLGAPEILDTLEHHRLVADRGARYNGGLVAERGAR